MSTSSQVLIEANTWVMNVMYGQSMETLIILTSEKHPSTIRIVDLYATMALRLEDPSYGQILTPAIKTAYNAFIKEQMTHIKSDPVDNSAASTLRIRYYAILNVLCPE